MEGEIKANACVIGDVELWEDGEKFTVERALVIQFPDVPAIKKAMAEGKCQFTVLGS